MSFKYIVSQFLIALLTFLEMATPADGVTPQFLSPSSQIPASHKLMRPPEGGSHYFNRKQVDRARTLGKELPDFKRFFELVEKGQLREMMEVVKELGQLGPAAQLEVLCLERLLKYSWRSCPSVALAVVDTLGKIGSRRAIQVLIISLWYDDRVRNTDGQRLIAPQVSIHKKVMETLVAQGPKAIPELVNFLVEPKSEEMTWTRLIGKVLIQMGPDASLAVPALVDILLDERTSRSKRAELAEILGEMKLIEAVPGLLIALEMRGHKDIRPSIAQALSNLGLFPEEAIAPFLSRLTAEQKTQLWNGIIYVANHTQQFHAEKEIENLLQQMQEVNPTPFPIHREFLAEYLVAPGILPTIGLKTLPKKDEVVQYPPTDIFPRDEGIFHSWESQRSAGNLEEAGSMISQVSILSDWFPGIDFIALTQLILFPPRDWDGIKAPARIERRRTLLKKRPVYEEVGLLLGSGGNIQRLLNMRSLPQGPHKTDRIDFLWGKDLRSIQLLMFAGISAQMPEDERNSQEKLGAAVWEQWGRARAKKGLGQILTDYGLHDLMQKEWFYQSENETWRTEKYGLRYERRYKELKDGIAALLKLLRSEKGLELQKKVKGLIEPMLDQLETSLWIEGLKKMPSGCLKIILGSDIDDAVKSCAVAAYLQKTNFDQTISDFSTIGAPLVPLMVQLGASGREEIEQMALMVLLGAGLYQSPQTTRDVLEELIEISRDSDRSELERGVAREAIELIINTDRQRALNRINPEEVKGLSGFEVTVTVGGNDDEQAGLTSAL